MAESNFPLTAEDGHDDLPRTFRRAREEKEREAKEREAKAQGGTVSSNPFYPPHDAGGYADAHEHEGVPATVKRFDVPFVSLMFFFLKAVVAAIPALILLGAIIWFAGDMLQSFFPWLVKMQVFIQFPD